ncbi:MAG: helix-turn-helix domain-containing protein, partial [Acidobacteriota bacterium]
MRKAYKYRIDVSDTIKEKLDSTLNLCRELYNAALNERNDAYKWQRKSISYQDQANQLSEIKAERKELKGIHSQVLQNVLKRIQTAFDNFFR